MNFVEEITRRNREQGKYLCVGLDPDAKKVEKALGRDLNFGLTHFTKEVIDTTTAVAAVYKPNLWFYLARGESGLVSLKGLISRIHQHDIPVLLDTKFGDIGTTSEKAAEFFFDWLEVDAITANPYLGQDAIQPLLDRKDKGIIFICKTSNKGSAEIQNQPLSRSMGLSVWKLVADRVFSFWNANGNCGLVVGATHPEELAKCREFIGPNLPLLIPGVGKQGGGLETSVKGGLGKAGDGVFVINVSSGICHASDGPDFAEAAGAAAEKYHNQITAALAQAKTA